MVIKFLKKALLFLFPLLLLILCYIITDPYKNIFDHKVYFSSYIMLSRGNISTKVYLKNREKYKYDSFIFGSSRSSSHTSKEWSKYLPPESVAYSFGAWNESIEGMYRRIKLIDSLKTPINNAFLIIDVDRTFLKSDIDLSNDFSDDHYLISQNSVLNYYSSDFMNYLKDPLLIITSVDYSLFHKKRNYMDKNRFIGMTESDLNPINNDWDVKSEERIEKDSINYYKDINNKFYIRTNVQQEAKRQITTKKEKYLIQIEKLFKKNKTKYKIVIAPLYDQVKLNTDDYKILVKIFKQENVYDYSGINSITGNKFNYNNDVLHYRKKVGDLIFKEIYKIR